MRDRFDELLEDVSIYDLFDVDELQKLQDDLSNAAGVASLLILPDGTPVTKASNFTHLCENLIRKSEKGRANCRKSDRIIGQCSVNGPTVQPCFSCGLWDAGAGISVSGKHIGSWLIGQVRNEAQDESVIYSYAKDIGIDPDEAVEAFLKVPSMPEERFRNVAQVLYRWTNQLSEMAFHSLKQKALIEELEISQKQLRKREENLRITLDSIGEGVITTDEKGCITGINPVAQKILQLNDQGLIGEKIENILHIVQLNTRKNISNPVLEVLNSGKRIELEEDSVLITQNGIEYIISDSAYPILDTDGEITGVVFVFSDKTDEYRNNEKLLHSQKMESFGQLTCGIAHDFNNILTSIMSAANLLERAFESKNVKTEKYISMIIKSSERASQLANGLLSISKSNSDIERIRLSDIVGELVNILKFTIDKRIVLKYEDKSQHSWMSGNSSAIQSVFMNLAINASHAINGVGEIKFILQNKMIDESYCKSSSFDINPGFYCSITVSDNGVGISDKIIDKIFDPFFTTKQKDKGTGLGLSSVKKIITDHHGEIKVESKIGIGTDFHILLPCSKHFSGAKSEDSVIAIEGNETVLIVDDEDFNRDLIKELLEMSGYNVMLASGGQKAIEIYKNDHKKIDLVILDMIMPGMDGEETFHKLKEINMDVNVIPITGNSEDSRIQRLKSEGVKSIITKPFSIDEFNSIVRKVLSKKHKFNLK